MGHFSTSTRKWLESTIKQRTYLIRHDKSHKQQVTVEISLDIVKKQLAAYSYENDLNMARFVIQFTDHISIILPGKGSASCDKKQREFTEIRKLALEISERTNRGINSIKSREYELLF